MFHFLTKQLPKPSEMADNWSLYIFNIGINIYIKVNKTIYITVLITKTVYKPLTLSITKCSHRCLQPDWLASLPPARPGQLQQLWSSSQCTHVQFVHSFKDIHNHVHEPVRIAIYLMVSGYTLGTLDYLGQILKLLLQFFRIASMCFSLL